jgi:hypothetical protein
MKKLSGRVYLAITKTQTHDRLHLASPPWLNSEQHVKMLSKIK